MAALDPLKLKLVNWAEVFGSEAPRALPGPAHPAHPSSASASSC